MCAMEPLYQLAGINPAKLSKNELIVLEADLFTRLCDALKDHFKTEFKNYFLLLKINAEMENAMLDEKLLRCVINDILSTEEYTLGGIAYYTETPEDVLYDVAMGRNSDPSATLFRKLIKLHRTVRPELYRGLLKKITSEPLTIS